jgi:hypothetical protein
MQKLQANRYLRILAVGFGSGGSDPFSLRSNLGHCLQIGRPRVKGARSGGAGSPEMASRGGARRTWPKSAVPGLKSTRLRVWDGQHAMRDPPGL